MRPACSIKSTDMPSAPLAWRSSAIWILALCIAICFNSLAQGAPGAGAPRKILNFDKDWRFFEGQAEGAQQAVFDDSGWRRLNVPHDWSIEGPFAQANKTGGAGGFLPSGIAWYRKELVLSPEDSGRHVEVEFDGVMANSDVWVNGQHLGRRPSGYVSFGYDLTPHLRPGVTNLLAVRTDTSQQPASRWYSGAGIYRHVRLVISNPAQIERWSTFVTTPRLGENEATVRIQSSVKNSGTVPAAISLRFTLRDPRGRVAVTGETPSRVVAAGVSTDFTHEMVVKQPRRWDIATPLLYQAVAEVRSADATIDEVHVPFGIREFEFRADSGFWLNGRNLKLYGVCLHHDGSAFGAAVPLAIWERRLAALRELGCNAIRTAHNPVAPEFLDLCDRMGFLVMDEFFDCWTLGKNPYDYHLDFNQWSKIDARDTIRRDRNHPSIVLYSVGNEIRDTPKVDLAKEILKGLVEMCHETDPTRPVTQALFRPNVSGDYTNGLADLLDVIGTNYRDNELLAAQQAKPDRKIVGTEQRHDRRTWLWLRDNPSHSGQFLWTGIDYLGESRRWPVVAAGSGLLDRTGQARPLGFERQSWWSPKPMVFMGRRVARSAEVPDDPGFDPLDRDQVLFADWTSGNPEPHEENVEVYSNCESVELFLNGRSLGAKPLNTDASPRNWKVRYEPGVLRGIARNGKAIVATQELRTAGKAAKIVLTTDRSRLTPDWDEVATVAVTVVDEHGTPVPGASDLIEFQITGSGKVVAVDSANNSSHEPFQAKQRRAYQGRCLAYVKATAAGNMTLTASAPGLQPGSINLTVSAR